MSARTSFGVGGGRKGREKDWFGGLRCPEGCRLTIVLVVFEYVADGLGLRLTMPFRCFLKRVWAALC